MYFRTFLLFFTLCILGTFATSAKVFAEEASLEKLQAAFIFKFTNYIEWPAQDSGTFTIGVYDNPEMFEAIKEAFAGKTVKNQPVAVSALKKLDKGTSFNILLLKNSVAAQSKDLLQLKKSGLLTVSYNPEGIAENVVINFYMSQNNLRFEIDNVKAGENNLKINSRLLNLAKSSK